MDAKIIRMKEDEIAKAVVNTALDLHKERGVVFRGIPSEGEGCP
jgi:hypothetical protein